jgi:hypothetical protein
MPTGGLDVAKYMDPIKESHQPRGHTLSLGNDWVTRAERGMEASARSLGFDRAILYTAALTEWLGLTGLVGDDRGQHGI